MSKTVLERLKEGRAILGEGPHRWTRGQYAVGHSAGLFGNQPIPVDATGYCALGACHTGLTPAGAFDSMLAVAGELRRGVYSKPAPSDCTDDVVVRFNDDPATTYEDILALFDKAIARLEVAS
jgi:hypothetical protein